MLISILPRLAFAHNLCQVVAIGDRVRMLRSQPVLADAECPLAKGLRLGIVALRKGEFGQVIKQSCGHGMLRSMRLLIENQGPLPKGLGLLKVSLFEVELCQHIEGLGNNEEVSRREDSFTGCQHLLKELLGLLVLALLCIELRQVDGGGQSLGVLGTKRLLVNAVSLP